MELDQKLAFLPKSSQNVASHPDQDFPDTVLLFEPRISYPALRVTRMKNYSKLNDFFRLQPEIFNEIPEKSNFFTFFIFFENCALLCPEFRPRNNL